MKSAAWMGGSEADEMASADGDGGAKPEAPSNNARQGEGDEEQLQAAVGGDVVSFVATLGSDRPSW